jgi:hypothetical protein
VDEVNAKSTWTVTAKFADKAGQPITPSAARYRIDLVDPWTPVLPWTPLANLAPTMEIFITSAQNAIIDAEAAVEPRIVTADFEYQDGPRTESGSGEYVYAVKNLKGELP